MILIYSSSGCTPNSECCTGEVLARSSGSSKFAVSAGVKLEAMKNVFFWEITLCRNIYCAVAALRRTYGLSREVMFSEKAVGQRTELRMIQNVAPSSIATSRTQSNDPFL